MLNALKIKPLAKALAAVAFFITTIGAGAGVALAAGTIYVNNGASCLALGPGTQTHPYCTIQQGVDAASPGDTVKVAKGTGPYNDPINVPKSLTLLGSQATVNAGGTNGMTLNANNITVQGFTFKDNSTGPAISTSKDFSGYTVARNTFTNNVFGLYLNSDGNNQSSVNRNTFNDNNQSGAAGGNGIYSDQGVKNVTIDHNTFKNQNNAAMIFVSTADAVKQQNLQINHNTFNGPGSMLILVNGQNVVFDHNQGSGFVNAAGVFLGGSDSNVQINHNDLKGAVDSLMTPAKRAFSGIRINVDQASYGSVNLSLVANNNVTVDHNTIKNFGDAGISVGDAVGSSTLTNSTFDHNSILNNGDVDPGFDAGILIRAGNIGLNVERNQIRNNQLFDAQDDSIGTGTAGTGNTWDHNSCGTSQPSALCS